MHKFRLRFHKILFPKVQLTISEHWFRKWLGPDQATSHYLKQCWFADAYMHHSASMSLYINTLHTVWISYLRYNSSQPYLYANMYLSMSEISFTDSKVQGAKMGPTWVLSSTGGPHVGPMNLGIRECQLFIFWSADQTESYYRKTCSISRTKSQSLNVSCILLQLFSLNPMELGVKLRMKMYMEQRWQVMLQLHLSYQQFYCLKCDLY